MRNIYRIEIVPWSQISTKLQRKLVNGQFILGGGKNVRHKVRQTNREIKTENPLLFTFS